MKYPGYVLIHPAWYIADWWIGDDDNYTCSSQQRESVLPYMLSVYQYEFIEDYERVAESGTVSKSRLAVMGNVLCTLLYASHIWYEKCSPVVIL